MMAFTIPARLSCISYQEVMTYCCGPPVAVVTMRRKEEDVW